MKKHKHSFLASRIMISSAGFTCLVFLAAIAWSSGASSQMQGQRFQDRNVGLGAKGIKIKNRTKAFQVIGVETSGQEVILNFRNDYDKNITAFALSPVNHRYLLRVDLIDSDEVIAPQASYTKELTLPDSQTDEATIIIRSVVFEDGTADGDLEISGRILDNRLGERVQMQRVAELLNDALKLPGPKLPKAFDSLKARIRDLPTDSDQPVSTYYRAGLHSAKENAIRHVESIEEHQPQALINDLSQELRAMKDRYNVRIAKRTH